MASDRADRPAPRRGLVGRILGDRYRVTSLVSAGANTLIADADDLALGRAVTIKLVRPEWAESAAFRRTFDQVMRRMSALSHPNLAAVYDWGEEVVGKRTTVYAVVEHLSGGSLRDLLDRGRSLDPSQALLVGLEACRGLDFAHKQKLVHTELTPSKLVFGDDRRLRIVDFGLARLLGEEGWREPATLPTHVARYASPEQALQQPVNGKSDIYSLALVLIEAVTRSVPFAARSTVATLSARVGRLMPVSADLGPLASVLERAGRPEPEDRGSAAELGRGLVAIASKLPRPAPIPILVSRPDDDPQQLRRPTDPTGGITRPPAEPLPAVVPPGAAAPSAAQSPSAEPETYPEDADPEPSHPSPAPATGAELAETGTEPSSPTMPSSVVAEPTEPGESDSAPEPTGESPAPTHVAPSDADTPAGTSDEATAAGAAAAAAAAIAATAGDASTAKTGDDEDSGSDPDSTQALAPSADTATGVADDTLDSAAPVVEDGPDAGSPGADAPDARDEPGAPAEDPAPRPAVSPAPSTEPTPNPDLATLVQPPSSPTSAAGAGVTGDETAKVPRVYDGDIDITKDELAKLAAAPSGAAQRDEPGSTAAATTTTSRTTAAAPTAVDGDGGPIDGPDDDAAPRRRWLTVLFGLLILIALAGLAVLAVVLFRTPTHPVPDLEGQTLAEAEAAVADFDWDIEVTNQRSDEQPTEGAIIRTEPAFGKDLGEGEPFLIVISEGPEFRALPELAGETIADAETSLARLRLAALTPTQANHETVPSGSVISWSVPADPSLVAGSEVLPDTEVAIVVSTGPAPRTVPDLTGTTPAEAETLLAAERLELEVAPAVFSDTVPSGQIVSVAPAVGASVPRDSVVTVVPSKGVDLVAVPDLGEMTLAQARQALSTAGLQVGTVIGNSQGRVALVLRGGDEVAAGDRIKRNSAVDLALI